MIVELQASEVAVSHIVIINTVDQPCGDLVAVVSDVTDCVVTARYLSNRIGMKECRGRLETVTPINAFGYRVMLDNGRFWCEPNGGNVVSTYENGDIRRWQEYGPVKYTPKPDVLTLAAVR